MDQPSLIRYGVSIHVPARGTTVMALMMSVASFGVSIHVPARGTTGLEMCFNPRSREGNDVVKKSACLRITCFNPRSREGNDAVD